MGALKKAFWYDKHNSLLIQKLLLKSGCTVRLGLHTTVFGLAMVLIFSAKKFNQRTALEFTISALRSFYMPTIVPQVVPWLKARVAARSIVSKISSRSLFYLSDKVMVIKTARCNYLKLVFLFCLSVSFFLIFRQFYIRIVLP